MSLDISSIREAESRIRPFVRETPLVYSAPISELAGCEASLKLEVLQPIGVFKIRGAFNRALALTAEEKSRGVVTASSGNHGIAVAYSAAALGISATVFVPITANPQKVEVIRSLGAILKQAGQDYHESWMLAIDHSRASGAVFVHAYDDIEVLAGQGTIGLELMRQSPDVEKVIVPVGGGGLISGIAAAMKQLKPNVKIVGVQSKGARAVYDSWSTGRIIESSSVNTIADGLAARRPGQNSFNLMRKYVDEMHLVTDEELRKAISIYMKKSRLIVEPAGAASLASLLWHNEARAAEKAVLVVSGGNISRELLLELAAEY